jgi:hypothetical protein
MFSSTRHVIRAIALSTFATVALPANAYDLVSDWSNSANPNGPWSYREGSIILPFNPSWTAGVNFPVVQPAYQPGNVPGNFLPAWYKATSAPPNLANFDNQIGDVIVHTNDQFNGNPALGFANVLFTTPVSGQYDIFGGLWDASHFFTNRPQDWILLVDGVNRASGVLSGAVPRISPRRSASQPSRLILEIPSSSKYSKTRRQRLGSSSEPI